MKKFWSDVAVEKIECGWQVTLDERAVRTQLGAAQLVPSVQAAELLASEWRAQGDEVDPKSFVFRDLADFAIDIVRPDRKAAIAKLIAYAETDTLCYRGEPGEPLWHRQQALWEPLVAGCEARHDIHLERVCGIIARPQPEGSLATLRALLEGESDFTIAALLTQASLTASLIVSLASLEDCADAQALFTAANLEEDWQAELWGWDHAAEEVRTTRMEAFIKASDFLRALRD